MMHLPNKNARIVVAMSGGVDSSVTAAHLKHQGYEVIGVSLQLHDASEQFSNKYGTCCTLSDLQDARRVAEKIGIPFFVSNMENEFEKAVIDDFVSQYLTGRTPNPCVRCNEKVKFSQLLDWALDLGADYLATGHYAVVENKTRPELHRGRSPEKDQSYFLFNTKESDLVRCIFPLGEMRKEEVRALAKAYQLSIANKPDSQEICFVQGGRYQEVVEKRVPVENRRAGPLKDESGNILGEHSGLYQFTIGQRKGLGIPSLDAQYVVAIEPQTNTVVIGPETSLFRGGCLVSQVTWVNGPPTPEQDLEAKIRYRAMPARCEINEGTEGFLEVQFQTPQRAITPGQAIVFYDGSRVAGGGWIERAL